MALKWKSKALLIKIETTYGVDAVPTAGANAILALNVSLNPMEGDDVARDIEKPFFGANPTIPVNVRAQLSFDVELVGSGTAGAAPAFGPLLRMCAAAEVVTAGSKVEYTPITDNIESGSIYFYIDTVRHVLLGSAGTAVLKTNAQGIPVVSFTLTGLFSVPSDQAKVTPVLSAFQKPVVVSKANTPTFTIGGTPFVMREFSLDFGNDVQPRMLVGQEAILVVDRSEKVMAKVEAVSMATYNPFALALAQTTQAIQLIHGTVAGKKVQVDVASAQLQRPTGYENQQGIAEWPLSFVPLPTAGNDQWKLTFN